jgi:hypothetical protein
MVMIGVYLGATFEEAFHGLNTMPTKEEELWFA